MPATLENIKGRDLPPAWRDKAQVGDDDVVSITITAHHPDSRQPIDKEGILQLARKWRKQAGAAQNLATFDDEFYDEFGLPK